jgi:hypothetical protein
MKTILSITTLLAVLAPAVHSQVAGKPQMRDAATHDQLSLAMRKAEQADPMRNLTPAKGGDPTLVNQPQDILTTSDIVCFGGDATLVPKRAIMSVPKNLGDRMKFQPGSKIMGWADFYAKNRGWITTIEVSRVQAQGNKALEEEVSNKISKSTNLVVATYQGGPISVLPLKVPAEDAAPAPTPTATATAQ